MNEGNRVSRKMTAFHTEMYRKKVKVETENNSDAKNDKQWILLWPQIIQI